MATQADVRRIALSLPETEEAPDRFAFSVRNKKKLKGFVWVWIERIEPKKPTCAATGRHCSPGRKPRGEGSHHRLGPDKVLHRAALQRVSRSSG